MRGHFDAKPQRREQTGAGPTVVTGSLTDTELRASAVAVSAAALPLPTGAATAAKQPALGTAGAPATDILTVQGIASMTALKVDGSGVTQPVSIAALPALVAGSAIIGKVGLDQTTPGTTNAVSCAYIGSTAVATGNGTAGAGVQRVTIASDNTAFSVNAAQSGTWNIGSITTLPALATGANVIGALVANQSVNNAQIGGVAVSTGSGVVGTGVQRVVLANDVALPAGTNTLGTTTGPTLTKGTQGATGYSTQDLKDAGRTQVSIATVIGGVTAVTAEALLSMVKVSAGVAGSAASSFAVTAGKTFRIQAIHVSVRSTSAAVLSGRFALRMNPSGAATATSPILAILACTQQAAALAEGGDGQVLPIPDGLEISGSQQIGLTQVCSAATGAVYATIIGYEY